MNKTNDLKRDVVCVCVCVCKPELTVSLLGLIIPCMSTVMTVYHKNGVKTADVLVMSLVYLPINTFLLSHFLGPGSLLCEAQLPKHVIM